MANLEQYLFHGQTKDDGIIPYLSAGDFPGLEVKKSTFRNREGQKTAVFDYRYPENAAGKRVLFLHGVGPGHKAYVREIETLCARGYRVLTLDYAGCGASEGEGLGSLYGPARDALELLERQKEDLPEALVGHSLGGFTGLRVMAKGVGISKAVLIAPLLDPEPLFAQYPEARAYEEQTQPELSALDVYAYLRETGDKLFFIHSEDDSMVPFAISTGWVRENIANPNFCFHIEAHRDHNPNYTDGAIAYMKETFGAYGRLLAAGKFPTREEKKAFMADKSPMEMTHQDPQIWEKIASFIG